MQAAEVTFCTAHYDSTCRAFLREMFITCIAFISSFFLLFKQGHLLTLQGLCKPTDVCDSKFPQSGSAYLALISIESDIGNQT